MWLLHRSSKKQAETGRKPVISRRIRNAFSPESHPEAMKNVRLLTLVFCLIFPRYTLSCAATGASPGTTPTTDYCPTGPSNTAGLTTNGVTAQNAGDTSTPVAYSSSCTAGERNYWTGASSAQPDDDEANAEKALGVQCPTPSSVCVCECNGVCCTAGSTAPDTISFVPYCSGGSCQMYAVLEGDETSSLTCTDGSTYTYSQQYASDGSYNPLTSGNYLQAASVSCNGCSGIQTDSCSPTTVTGSTPIS
ncbi:unnamed protein product [Bursaphelenchus okinawaensis]|uniref:Uncharacterized protein n=1 Tax=Bursaphelenchus okinawaensis TaxID=465554 RepID=A0A811K8I4_9BILA|nr:unnamed protein product [Bursaphelenchus okinawaensis]CAG9096105.1 unnamed protein product [Bursaphelenchus okinawaensis]